MFRFKSLFTNLLNKCRRSYSNRDCNPIVPCTKFSALSNGMRIVTEESDSPVACVALFVQVGPMYEKPANFGITHFIEHMAYRGFNTMGKQQLDERLAEMGAKMSVRTTREFQMFYAECCVEDVSDIVRILSKIVTDLELSDSEMEEAKRMIDMESYDVDQNTKAVLSDYLHETAFQCSPLSRRIIGPSRNIKKFDKKVVQFYMKENYHPVRFVLVTSGAVKHDSMVNDAQACFGDICSNIDVCYHDTGRFTGSQILYRDDSMPFVYVAIAVEAPGRISSDYIPMLLASNIIGSWCKSQGGHDRHGSVLARAAATSRLCNKFESFYIPYRDVGLWGVYMVAEKMNIDDMVHNLLDRWMHLCTTTISHDVQRGIGATKVELAKTIEGSVKSCYDLGMQAIYHCKRQSLPEMYGLLANNKNENIKNVAFKYLYDKCPAVSAIGPTEVLSDYTRIRAGMYWLRY